MSWNASDHTQRKDETSYVKSPDSSSGNRRVSIMSWELVRRVFEQSKAKPMARLVLLNLAERASPASDDTAWPSRETIARECGLSLRGTHDLLRYLRKIGEISFEDGKPSGRNRTNRYRLTLPNTAPGAGLAPGEMVQVTARNGASGAHKPEEPVRSSSGNQSPPNPPDRPRASRVEFGW